MKQLPVLFLCLSEACVDGAVGFHRGLYGRSGSGANCFLWQGPVLLSRTEVCGRGQCQAGQSPTLLRNQPGKVTQLPVHVDAVTEGRRRV